jgi:hypothetical protein
MLQRIQSVLKRTVSALVPSTTKECQRLRLRERGLRCFELFAVDLLVDVLGRVWILEVNSRPGLQTQNNVLEVLKGHHAVKAPMLADMFNLVYGTSAGGGGWVQI